MRKSPLTLLLPALKKTVWQRVRASSRSMRASTLCERMVSGEPALPAGSLPPSTLPHSSPSERRGEPRAAQGRARPRVQSS
jgi:hypothetical protein